jgi:uncharacterized MnhB-related membrane protein
MLRRCIIRFVSAKRNERKKIGTTRRTGLQQYRLFMWIATALWLIAAIAAVIDRDTLNAVAWFGFVAAGALTASGATERSKGLAYLSIALLVAAVAILIGVFLTD